MGRQLDAIPGLAWSFFDACESVPDFLIHDPVGTQRSIRRDLTGGELGCFASHVSLWRWFLGQIEHDALIVLEDDLQIDPFFFAALDRFCACVPDAAFVRFHAKAPTYARPIRMVMGRHLIRYRGIAFGTQGYIIRRQGAERFVRSITRITRPIDDEMDRYWVHQVPNIGLHPFPIMELGFPSTIEAQRRGKPQSSAPEYLRWKGHRALDSLRRRFANLRLALSEPRV